MNPVLDAAAEIESHCVELGIAYCFIGGLAVLRWGEPRRAANGTPIDVALGALPFEERTTERASRWRIRAGIELLTCSAEDLVVHKVFAGRDRDWLDVQGIIDRCGRDLDRARTGAELAPLLELKDAMSNMDRLEEILERDTQ